MVMHVSEAVTARLINGEVTQGNMTDNVKDEIVEWAEEGAGADIMYGT